MNNSIYIINYKKYSIYRVLSRQEWYYDVDRNFCLRVIYPKTITPLWRPLLRATVSFSSSLEFHRDNNPRRREEVDDGSEGGGKGRRKRRSHSSPCSRAMLPLGGGGRLAKGVAWEDEIGRIVLIKRPRNVGRWLNPVIDLEARAPGGVAREGNIQIPSLLAQRITNARRNGVEYYYSTILATLSPTLWRLSRSKR